jgi:hypothetical protein
VRDEKIEKVLVIENAVLTPMMVGQRAVIVIRECLREK